MEAEPQDRSLARPHGGWLSVWPAPPVCGVCVRGLWLKQAHADHPAVVIDTLDEVPVQLELGHDGSRERDPVGVQVGEGDRLVAGLTQSVEQPLLLGVSVRHRPDCRPLARLRKPRRFPSRAAGT